MDLEAHPLYARVIDRGCLVFDATSELPMNLPTDIAAFELFTTPVVSSDPLILLHALQAFINSGGT